MQHLSMDRYLPDLKKISLDVWDHPVFRENQLRVEILRLDKIHPEISGNKWFKLKYYLEKAIRANKRNLVSFGGAYSNHLLALAAIAKLNGLNSTGIIRGEEPPVYSPTLSSAIAFGMKLQFLSRSLFDLKKKSASIYETDDNESDSLWIPEGGASYEGIRGAEEILSEISYSAYSHICCAVGTGVTLAGLINSSDPHQIKIGVSVLKGTRGLEPMQMSWIKNPSAIERVQMIHDSHFGGYARKTNSLVDFMNRIYTESGIPTDFVYTGKLFHSIIRIAAEKAFLSGSRILVLHTGGLQGNRSFAPGVLQF